jgi:hypothetical protein
MVPVKMVVTGMIVAAVFAGCTKQKPSADKLATPEQTATVPTPAAQQDIFDEFYKADSSPSPKSQTKSSRKESARRSSSDASPSFVEGGRYVVQVATHPSQRLAEATKAKMSALGYPCYIAEVQNPTPALSGTYYRVRVGGFSSASAARAFGEQSLVPEGYQYWVDNRSNDNVGLGGSGFSSGTAPYGSEPEPASSYQSSYQSTPAQEPAAAAPAPEPTPAPASTAPAPSPAPAEKKPASGTQSEWGNDGW